MMPLGFESDAAEKQSCDSEFVRFPLPSESSLRSLVKKEQEYALKSDYLMRMLSERQLPARRNDAIDWMWKVHAVYKFGPLSAYLCVNYLDRFLSYYDFPEEDQPWSTQLLSVACLSVAAKMEKVEVPPPFLLQICEPKYVFSAKTIRKIEFTLLSKLGWRTQAVTPFTYIDFFLDTISGGHPPSHLMVSRCTEIILNTARVIDMMEFWPSEVAASTALLVLGDAQVVNVEENFPHCSLVSKRKVWQCYGVIQYLEMARQRDHQRRAPASSPVPESPVGILDYANLSIKSDDPIADQSHKTSACKRKASRLTCPFKRRRISRLRSVKF